MIKQRSQAEGGEKCIALGTAAPAGGDDERISEFFRFGGVAREPSNFVGEQTNYKSGRGR